MKEKSIDMIDKKITWQNQSITEDILKLLILRLNKWKN